MQIILKPSQIQQFHTRILDWFSLNGRKKLPWQQPASAYRVWVSEVMLQQTQVDTVIPYFEKFMQAFPTLQALAAADIDQVLHLWSGLGYYARGRNLHKTAIILMQANGKLPTSVDALQQLPGIGRSTAGAIQSLAFGGTAAILDGNVKRVLSRHYRIDGWVGKSSVLKQFWRVSEQLTPNNNTAYYNQAMMDVGSLICRRSNPICMECPVQLSCQAKKYNEILRYPSKKPYKAKPIKKQRFFLIYNQRQDVLLYRRPSTGIWGGLWCLPNEDALPTALLEPENLLLVNRFTHQFSHFTLQAKIFSAAIHSDTNKRQEVMDGTNWSWYDLDNPKPLGMPAPIMQLLKEIKPQEPTS